MKIFSDNGKRKRRENDEPSVLIKRHYSHYCAQLHEDVVVNVKTTATKSTLRRRRTNSRPVLENQTLPVVTPIRQRTRRRLRDNTLEIKYDLDADDQIYQEIEDEHEQIIN